MKKKIAATLMTAVLVMTLLPTVALAHGHRTAAAASTRYPLCTVAGCSETYAHQHDSAWYCGHTLNDGHDYHQLCPTQGCTQTAVHQHDGVTCFPHSSGDGHSYHSGRHGGKGHH